MVTVIAWEGTHVRVEGDVVLRKQLFQLIVLFHLDELAVVAVPNRGSHQPRAQVANVLRHWAACRGLRDVLLHCLADGQPDPQIPAHDAPVRRVHRRLLRHLLPQGRGQAPNVVGVDLPHRRPIPPRLSGPVPGNEGVRRGRKGRAEAGHQGLRRREVEARELGGRRHELLRGHVEHPAVPSDVEAVRLVAPRDVLVHPHIFPAGAPRPPSDGPVGDDVVEGGGLECVGDCLGRVTRQEGPVDRDEALRVSETIRQLLEAGGRSGIDDDGGALYADIRRDGGWERDMQRRAKRSNLHNIIMYTLWKKFKTMTPYRLKQTPGDAAADDTDASDNPACLVYEGHGLLQRRRYLRSISLQLLCSGRKDLVRKLCSRF